MIRLSQRIKMTLLLSVVVTLLIFPMVGCEYFPESTFELSNESRLPRWFTLPPGLARTDVSVTMSYYVKTRGRTATFVLHDTKNHTLAKMDGKLEGLEPLLVKTSQSKPPDYPSFEVIAIEGVTEIVEHKKMEPIFYLSDDPTVWKELTGIQPSAGGPVSGPKHR